MSWCLSASCVYCERLCLRFFYFLSFFLSFFFASFSRLYFQSHLSASPAESRVCLVLRDLRVKILSAVTCEKVSNVSKPSVTPTAETNEATREAGKRKGKASDPQGVPRRVSADSMFNF